jgi:hypothetical protein
VIDGEELHKGKDGFLPSAPVVVVTHDKAAVETDAIGVVRHPELFNHLVDEREDN